MPNLIFTDIYQNSGVWLLGYLDYDGCYLDDNCCSLCDTLCQWSLEEKVIRAFIEREIRENAIKNRKQLTVSGSLCNRGDVIRTRGLYVPNVALYQAEPHPAITDS